MSRDDLSYDFQTMDSPVGALRLVADAHHLIAILWDNEPENRVRLPPLQPNDTHPVLRATRDQLNDYFKGLRTTFELPLRLVGSAFDLKVWAALQKIPYGTTISYQTLAEAVQSPRAYRAVGSANGRNPLSIVVPCHRVIAANGQLSGFAGGIDKKAFLIDFERRAQSL